MVRIGALDGMRALAVAGVLAYHAGLAEIGGGLLGVDVFFAVSGFLITSLLLAERDRSGRISLAGFWKRRALRLLPALLLTLAGVAVYSHWVQIVAPSQLRGDFLATLFYGANWHFIAANQSYFSQYTLSPLLHTWSLSVEEQFYVVWPVVALVTLKLWGRRGIAWVAGVGVAASAAWMAVLYRDHVAVSRLYYGTDTRAQTLLAGCLLAALLAGRSQSAEPSRLIGTAGGSRLVGIAGRARLIGTAGRARLIGPAGRSRLIGVAGWAGMGFILWSLHAVSGTGGFLYQGGFLLVALSACAVIASAATRPAGVLARALSLPPLRYVGRISYGLYLYHWPLFLALDYAHTGLSGYPLLALRLGVTAVVAVLSFHLVEEPIRTGRLVSGWSRWKAAGAGTFGALAATGALLVVTTTSAAAVPASARPTVSQQVEADSLLGEAPPSAAPPAGTPVVNAMVVGDSMGLTLAEGLQDDSTGWGVSIDDQAALGCDLDPSTTVNVVDGPGPAGQGCPHWATQWAQLAKSQDPDVAVLLMGRFETADRLWDGHWISTGNAAFDTHLQDELVQAIDALSSNGAKVVLLTLPYVAQTTDQPNGSPWPINQPARTNAWNSILYKAAAERPGVASVVDLNAMLDPQGHYTDFVDGVRVRMSDREHISLQGGMLVRSSLLPGLAHLGLAHAELRADG